jgi:NADPH2:quinone reductase
VIETALEAVRPGGKLLVFGVAPADARVSWSPYRIYRNDITVLGSMAFLFTFAPAIDVLLAGGIATDELLSHQFGLDDFAGALEATRGGEGVKVQVVP